MNADIEQRKALYRRLRTKEVLSAPEQQEQIKAEIAVLSGRIKELRMEVRLNNGSMFSDLCKYESEDFYQEHKIIHFDTLESFGEYEVIAAFKTVAYSEEGFISAPKTKRSMGCMQRKAPLTNMLLIGFQPVWIV